jgi:hypothetical protein
MSAAMTVVDTGALTCDTISPLSFSSTDQARLGPAQKITNNTNISIFGYITVDIGRGKHFALWG